MVGLNDAVRLPIQLCMGHGHEPCRSMDDSLQATAKPHRYAHRMHILRHSRCDARSCFSAAVGRTCQLCNAQPRRALRSEQATTVAVGLICRRCSRSNVVAGHMDAPWFSICPSRRCLAAAAAQICAARIGTDCLHSRNGLHTSRTRGISRRRAHANSRLDNCRCRLNCVLRRQRRGRSQRLVGRDIYTYGRNAVAVASHIAKASHLALRRRSRHSACATCSRSRAGDAATQYL